jgi:hypothetical protein
MNHPGAEFIAIAAGASRALPMRSQALQKRCIQPSIGMHHCQSMLTRSDSGEVAVNPNYELVLKGTMQDCTHINRSV